MTAVGNTRNSAALILAPRVGITDLQDGGDGDLERPPVVACATAKGCLERTRKLSPEAGQGVEKEESWALALRQSGSQTEQRPSENDEKITKLELVGVEKKSSTGSFLEAREAIDEETHEKRAKF